MKNYYLKMLFESVWHYPKGYPTYCASILTCVLLSAWHLTISHSLYDLNNPQSVIWIVWCNKFFKKCNNLLHNSTAVSFACFAKKKVFWTSSWPTAFWFFLRNNVIDECKANQAILQQIKLQIFVNIWKPICDGLNS